MRNQTLLASRLSHCQKIHLDDMQPANTAHLCYNPTVTISSEDCTITIITSLTPQKVRQLRLRAQGLSAESLPADAAQVVRALCGLQSQELSSAHLALRARTSGLVSDDIKHAREVERSIVLTWTMRGTMHLVAAEDVKWQLSLFGPLFIQKTASRYKQLGLTDTIRRSAARHIQAVLSSQGPLTRAELAQALAAQGIPVEGQAIHHLVRYAALSGVICFGPEHDRELTYVVLDDWLKGTHQRQLDQAQILPELARRYLLAYAPAAPPDLASWSGISLSQAKAGFKALSADLVEVAVPDGTGMMLKHEVERLRDDAPERTVRLLPRYDNYLLGYRSRAFMVQDDFAREIHPGGGLIRSCVIVDGQAQAVWRMEQRRDTAAITIQPFAPIDPTAMPHLQAEAQDIGRFLKLNTSVNVKG